MTVVHDLTTPSTSMKSMCFLAGMWVACIIGIMVQRLWLSPISHIPGPKLAALTQLYEFYYDFVLGEQYTLRIREMHKVYGPVVRISPWEVHIADPDVHAELYTDMACPQQKTYIGTRQSGFQHGAPAASDHDYHKPGRGALSRFFLTQPFIEEKVHAMLHALVKYVNKQILASL